MTVAHFDWRLDRGIASFANFCLLLVVLAAFPFLVVLTGGFGVTEVPPQGPQHTWAYVRACLILAVFLWTCFLIVHFGIRRERRTAWREVIGPGWHRWQDVLRDIAIAFAVLVAMALIGGLSNTLLGPFQGDNPVLRAMASPQNALEALAFLVVAFSAGFVEEFVFRGYIQKQLQAMIGVTLLASFLQVVIFTAGHIYQGWIRLIPVFLIGIVLTIVALWRKSLVPGMIAHALGDGLVAFMYFAKHL